MIETLHRLQESRPRRRLHIKDSGRTRQKAAVSAVEFAYGSEAEDMPPVNAVVGSEAAMELKEGFQSKTGLLGLLCHVSASSNPTRICTFRCEWVLYVCVSP